MKKFSLFLLFFSLLVFEVNAKEYVSQNDINKMKNEYGKTAAIRLSNWNKVMKNAEDKEEIIKVRNINSYFNQFRYRKDKYNWKNIEYWASFSEFIGKGRGDCEDYALAKYYSLRKLGVPAKRLKLISGKFYKYGHLALGYYKNPKDPYFLDNNKKYLGKVSRTYQFKPETYFNESEYGVLNPKISKKRAKREFQYFFAWISKNNVNISW